MHVTNAKRQEQAGGVETKVSASAFWGEVEAGEGLAPGATAARAMAQMQAAVARVVGAAEEALIDGAPRDARALWGADFMFDATTLRPWLLEVQVHPSLALTSDVKRAALAPVLDALRSRRSGPHGAPDVSMPPQVEGPQTM